MTIFRAAYRKAYWFLHFRHFLLTERLSGYRVQREVFRKVLGYDLDLDNPRSFNEKLYWRKIYDRNPLLPIVVDKYAARGYITERLGRDRAEELLVPLLHKTRRPETIPFEDLPERYAIKANHGCGMHLIVRPEFGLERDRIVDQCREWLRATFGLYDLQWAYSRVDPCVLVETLLERDGDLPPDEIKLHMFDGKCRLIQVHHGDFWDDGSRDDPSTAPTLTFYSEHWDRLDIECNYRSGPAEGPPSDFDEMLEVAEALSKSWDYLRVDFFLTRDGFRIGELTPYSWEGKWKVEPREFDFELGALWTLPR